MRELVAVIALTGCFDFGLDERRFRCDEDPTLCGDGLICDEGVCVLDEGQEICRNGIDDDGDDFVDCADVDCGQAACDDSNPCTSDICVANGVCENEADVEGSCGIGCTCNGGVPEEVACGDLVDNDADEMPDCQDPDCPMCAGGLQCCPNGECRPGC